MSKKAVFSIFILSIVTLTLMVIAFYPQASKNTQVALKKSVIQTVLSFGQPVIAEASSPMSYSIPIEISTGENKVTAVQLEMQYDPEVLADVTIVPGQFFVNSDILLDQINAKTGRISYALGVGLTAQGISGKGIIANIIFYPKTKIQEKTAIQFLPKTLVTATGANGSVLKQVVNGFLTL